MSLWFRRGSREDPVVLDKRLTAIERQLNIDPIVAGGTGTGLIAVTASGGGTDYIYVPVSMPGTVRTATATPYRVPVAGTLTNIWVNMTTASSSGSVTVRLNIGASDYDVTVTSGNTSNSSTPNVSLAAGDLIIPEVTAAGTGAADLTCLFKIDPT